MEGQRVLSHHLFQAEIKFRLYLFPVGMCFFFFSWTALVNLFAFVVLKGFL